MDFNYYAPAFDFLAPARRASIGMFVLAAFGLLCGVCAGAVVWFVPIDQMLQQLQQAGYPLPEPQGQFSPEQLIRFRLVVMSGLVVALGIAFIVLGIFVRRGRKWAAIVSLVICLPLLLYTLLSMLLAVPIALKSPAMLPGMLVVLIPAILLGLIVAWLFQTIRVAPQLAAQQQQMLAQMWQYQQQQTAYVGYNQPQVAPAPPLGGPVDPAAPKAPEAQSSPPPPNPPDAST